MKGGLSTTEQNRDEREAAAKDEGRTDLSAGDVEPLKASGFSFFSSCFFFLLFHLVQIIFTLIATEALRSGTFHHPSLLKGGVE